MSLLEKFTKVEIKADERISAEDKKFCKAHQSAYDDSRSSLQELQFYWETMLESQKQLLSSIGENNHTMYLSDHSNLTISVRDIEKQTSFAGPCKVSINPDKTDNGIFGAVKATRLAPVAANNPKSA